MTIADLPALEELRVAGQVLHFAAGVSSPPLEIAYMGNIIYDNWWSVWPLSAYPGTYISRGSPSVILIKEANLIIDGL